MTDVLTTFSSSFTLILHTLSFSLLFHSSIDNVSVCHMLEAQFALVDPK
jgi:hypothetical protein